MLEQLRAWLNGKREYYAGVALLAEAGGAAPVLAVLKKGPTAFSIAKLESELLAICKQLKAANNAETISYRTTGSGNSGHHPGIQINPNPGAQGPDSAADQRQAPENQALFEICRKEALTIYKTAMNDRAILFSLANNLSAEETNLPHHIEARAKLAIAVVRNFNAASLLFDRADFVKKHGRLPDGEASEAPESLYDALPDDQVYDTLTNLRKAYSKLKSKEQTPERIALMQQHSANILKLEGRWRLLKGK